MALAELGRRRRARTGLVLPTDDRTANARSEEGADRHGRAPVRRERPALRRGSDALPGRSSPTPCVTRSASTAPAGCSTSAAGPGSLTLLLAPLFAEAVGVDADPDMVAEARRARRRPSSGGSCAAEELPADLGIFRVVDVRAVLPLDGSAAGADASAGCSSEAAPGCTWAR